MATMKISSPYGSGCSKQLPSLLPPFLFVKTRFLPSSTRLSSHERCSTIASNLALNLGCRGTNRVSKPARLEAGLSMDAGINDADDKLREECGIVGILGHEEATFTCYKALHALQHRGQEGAGIVSTDGLGGKLHAVTGLGLVSEVFNRPGNSLENLLPGNAAIGHVRYATSGATSALENVQPFVSSNSSFAVAHNGNLTNAESLKLMLEQEDGVLFTTSSDTEVILHLLEKSLQKKKMEIDFIAANVIEACEQLQGAFSLVILTKDEVIAVRDPYGFRPLVMGKHSSTGAYIFASETCAFDAIHAKYICEIQPGEVVVVDRHHMDQCFSYQLVSKKPERKACIFEHIYFALPTSTIFGLSVYASRYRYGEILAEEAPVDCDVVISVPDSGNVAALGYAHKAHVPFHHGLMRSHYAGRTFIEPSQELRESAVSSKFVPVSEVLKGKRVVVIDDSIVRGTTSKKIVKLIRNAGATEVHMRIASPPIVGSCYYGVDTPRKEELISHRLSVEDTRKAIGVDSLAFLPLERLKGMLGNDASTFCYACMSGHYPI